MKKFPSWVSRVLRVFRGSRSAEHVETREQWARDNQENVEILVFSVTLCLLKPSKKVTANEGLGPNVPMLGFCRNSSEFFLYIAEICISKHAKSCDGRSYREWPSNQIVLSIFRKFLVKPLFALMQNIAGRSPLVKQCFVTWPNNQTLLVKQIFNVWSTMFDRLARAWDDFF